MPNANFFKSNEGYYSTLFHEMIHSTGHASRLKREGVTNYSAFGSHSYAKEELVAEFGASFLRGLTGIETKNEKNNSVAYLQSWIKSLTNDPSLLIGAAGQAQKACDFILGVTYETDETD